MSPSRAEFAVVMAVVASSAQAQHHTAEAIGLFRQGRLFEARRAADACAARGDDACRSAAAQIREFQWVARGAPRLSLEAVRRLDALDRALLVGDRGKAYVEVVHAVAKWHCQQAAKVLGRGDGKAACTEAKTALDVAADDACALGLLKRINDIAQRRVMTARRQRDGGQLSPEEMMAYAKERCDRSWSMVPADSSLPVPVFVDTPTPAKGTAP